jgi:hypothetical protein
LDVLQDIADTEVVIYSVRAGSVIVVLSFRHDADALVQQFTDLV